MLCGDPDSHRMQRSARRGTEAPSQPQLPDIRISQHSTASSLCLPSHPAETQDTTEQSRDVPAVPSGASIKSGSQVHVFMLLCLVAACLTVTVISGHQVDWC